MKHLVWECLYRLNKKAEKSIFLGAPSALLLIKCSELRFKVVALTLQIFNTHARTIILY